MTQVNQNHIPYSAHTGGAGKSPEPSWAGLLDPGKQFYGDRRIEGLYRMLFDNPYVYRAYYDLRVIPGMMHAAESNSPKVLPRFVPMALTLSAANQAAGMSLVKPHERALVHLAAIVSPCGLFLVSNLTGENNQPAIPTWDEISFTRFVLLERPLTKIKGVHVEMGNTLAAILGQSYSHEDVDMDQVTRLATAVQFSDARLAAYWSPQATAPRRWQ